MSRQRPPGQTWDQSVASRCVTGDISNLVYFGSVYLAIARLAVSVGLRSSVHIQPTGNCTKFLLFIQPTFTSRILWWRWTPRVHRRPYICIPQQTPVCRQLVQKLGQKIRAAQVRWRWKRRESLIVKYVSFIRIVDSGISIRYPELILWKYVGMNQPQT